MEPLKKALLAVFLTRLEMDDSLDLDNDQIGRIGSVLDDVLEGSDIKLVI